MTQNPRGRRALRSATLSTARLRLPVPVQTVQTLKNGAVRATTPADMPSRVFRRAAWRLARKTWGKDDPNPQASRRGEWRAAWLTCTVWGWHVQAKARAAAPDETTGDPNGFKVDGATGVAP